MASIAPRNVNRGRVNKLIAPLGGTAIDYSKAAPPALTKQPAPKVSKQPNIILQMYNPDGQLGLTVAGGWLQLNYTVMPYVFRYASEKPARSHPQLWLPLSVLRNAANLLTDVEIGAMRATPEESAFLNHCCSQADVAFKFVKHTKLVTLDAVLALHKGSSIYVQELSPQDMVNLAQQPSEPQRPATTTSLQAATVVGKQSLRSKTDSKQEQIPRGPGKHRQPTVASIPDGTVPQASVGNNSVVIQPARLCGKSISCLVREDGRRYVLLDALCRVYFPNSNVRSLQHAIEREAKLPTKTMTVLEEKAFIAFYRLPLKVLRCRLLLDIEYVAPHLNALQMVLRSEAPERRAHHQNSATGARKPAPESPARSSESSKSKRGSLSSCAGPPNERRVPDAAESRLKVARSAGMETRPSGQTGGFKTKRRRLEDTINKLKHVTP